MFFRFCVCKSKICRRVGDRCSNTNNVIKKKIRGTTSFNVIKITNQTYWPSSFPYRYPVKIKTFRFTITHEWYMFRTKIRERNIIEIKQECCWEILSMIILGEKCLLLWPRVFPIPLTVFSPMSTIQRLVLKLRFINIKVRELTRLLI